MLPFDAIDTVETKSFGKLSDQHTATLYTLRNSNGISATLSNYGARLISFLCPDRQGQLGDIVLGFDDVGGYLKSSAYMGATVGRYANRISGASFKIDDRTFALSKNCGMHHLHGGSSGFDSRLWHAETFAGSEPSVRFSLFSPDGDQGYPGSLTVHLSYTLNKQNQLIICIEAQSDADTPISITNHSYFNLALKGSVLDHDLQLESSAYARLNSNQIPTGELSKVENSPFDFRMAKKLGEHINADHEQIKIGSGYDHNFVTPAMLSGEIELAATLRDPSSGRCLKISTNAPGIQLYTANFLDEHLGKGVRHQARHCVCLEPQNFPDAPNRSEFPSSILKAGEQYQHTMIFQSSIA